MVFLLCKCKHCLLYTSQLTPKQQAAVEQAVVMACGYCRTVADQNRQENLEQLRQLGVQIEPVNREKYLALLADIYQYDAGNMLYQMCIRDRCEGLQRTDDCSAVHPSSRAGAGGNRAVCKCAAFFAVGAVTVRFDTRAHYRSIKKDSPRESFFF